jgi:hypothetical protein
VPRGADAGVHMEPPVRTRGKRANLLGWNLAVRGKAVTEARSSIVADFVGVRLRYATATCKLNRAFGPRHGRRLHIPAELCFCSGSSIMCTTI